MSQAEAVPGGPAVRASDAERDQAAEILGVAYAQGCLTRTELDERIDGAYAAKTRADLSDLTGDLPSAIPAQQEHHGPLVSVPSSAGPAHTEETGMCFDRCLLVCLLIACPPAGVAYWILAARTQPSSYARDTSGRARVPVRGGAGSAGR
jgi:hypothetical protein